MLLCARSGAHRTVKEQPPGPHGCRISTAAHPAQQVIAELSCLESLASLTLRGWTRGPVVTLAALAALRALTALQITFLEDGPVRRGTRRGWRPRLPRPTAVCAHAPTATGAWSRGRPRPARGALMLAGVFGRAGMLPCRGVLCRVFSALARASSALRSG
jgi:hypothetical protein